jgi:hypothetical protein
MDRRPGGRFALAFVCLSIFPLGMDAAGNSVRANPRERRDV